MFPIFGLVGQIENWTTVIFKVNHIFVGVHTPTLQKIWKSNKTVFFALI